MNTPDPSLLEKVVHSPLFTKPEIPELHTKKSQKSHSADEILDVGDHPYDIYHYTHSGIPPVTQTPGEVLTKYRTTMQ